MAADRVVRRWAAQAADGAETRRPPDRLADGPVVLRETSVADPAVPRMELTEWASRYGIVAGVTTRGHGFSLGLWSQEPVGQVITPRRAFPAPVRGAFPAPGLCHPVARPEVRRAERQP